MKVEELIKELSKIPLELEINVDFKVVNDVDVWWIIFKRLESNADVLLVEKGGGELE